MPALINYDLQNPISPPKSKSGFSSEFLSKNTTFDQINQDNAYLIKTYSTNEKKHKIDENIDLALKTLKESVQTDRSHKSNSQLDISTNE